MEDWHWWILLFLAGLAVGNALGMAGRGRVAVVLAALIVPGLWIMDRIANGPPEPWSGVILAMVAAIYLAPVIVGLLVGAALGRRWARRRRR